MLDAVAPAKGRRLALEVRVRGTVQGVGFRPTVWRIARECGVVGSIRNDAQGVLIEVGGRSGSVSDFLARIEREAPPLGRIESIEARTLGRVLDAPEFRIDDSVAGEQQTHVAADAAICAACRAEVMNPSERRFGYPFTNCTHCGPRLSIVKAIPYDRHNTTMSRFTMCADCHREYTDPDDRRFHAQPIACPACGPTIWLERRDSSGRSVRPDRDTIDACITEIVRVLCGGEIAAIRGLGGYHLACDATDADGVARLRRRKLRYGKPFALMARDLDQIARFCRVSPAERALLESPEAPIVLLQANGRESLPEAIAPGLNAVGFMLPYTPLHLLIMQRLESPLVMTSGNLSNEPQVTDNETARDVLLDIADVLVAHDRDIANRIDDSVVQVVGDRPRLIRRARGYAPRPIYLPEGFANAPEVLAFGAELKSTFCLAKNGAAILSQHQGDLEDVDTYEDYRSNLGLYAEMYGSRPEVLAADLHPRYLSTQLAEHTATNDAIELVKVQHHHAHIASCMIDNAVALDAPPVLGVALDGLGLGDDDQIWGGEFLLASYRSYRRLGTFKPTAMIGGTQAIREPWRNTYAHIVEALGWARFSTLYRELDLCQYLLEKPLDTFDEMLARGLNVPLASSCGRLFDAVCAALGIRRAEAQFEGQAAMELEAIADRDALRSIDGFAGYPFATSTDRAAGIPTLDPAPMWVAMLADLAAGVPASLISARFHRGLARAVVEMVQRVAGTHANGRTRPRVVALSGGCFQNRILMEEVTAGVVAAGFECLSHREVPSNDGGVALGQAAIAMARRMPPRSDDSVEH